MPRAMEPTQRYFGSTGEGGLLTASAFSAYSLLRNCNYLMGPQDSDIKAASRPAPDQQELHRPQLREVQALPPLESSKNFTSKSFLAPPIFSYSNPLLLSNEPIARCSNPVPPCSSLYSTNFRKQRSEKRPIPDNQKDDKYFERRRRNNQAAKKSRDARKMREDQIALRATILEHENAILRAQVITLREEASSLRQLLLQKKTLEMTSRESHICLT